MTKPECAPEKNIPCLHLFPQGEQLNSVKPGRILCKPVHRPQAYCMQLEACLHDRLPGKPHHGLPSLPLLGFYTEARC